MKDNAPHIGMVVFSKSGRDMGRYYIVTQVIDKDYVYICDGKIRPIAKPKKKKIKHLSLLEDCLAGIAEKLESGKKVYDKELGSALRTYNEKI